MRRDHGGRQRLGHIADAAADQPLRRFGIRIAKGFHAAGDFGEKVTGFELEVIVVEESHGAAGCSARLQRAQWGKRRRLRAPIKRCRTASVERSVSPMSTAQIVAFAGSSRTGSFNQKLLRLAVEAARQTGAEVTLVDLRELALPLYDQDLEDADGLPPGAKRFKTLLRESDGFLIASPEYNSSIAPLLKNALDWASRSEADDEPPLVAFRGKVAALVSASPSALGGLRGLVQLRSLFGNIGVLLLPEQVCVSAAYEAFDDTGALKDARKAKQLKTLAENLVTLIDQRKS